MKELSEFEEKRKIEGQKPTEGSAVIQMQSEAVDKLKRMETRKYTESVLSIRTVGGSVLRVKGWSTEEEPKTLGKNIKKDYVCDICSKDLTDEKELNIHKEEHNSKAEEE